MIDIPRDIWLHIAEFIPEADMRSLITVNSVFFDLGMEARYREVYIRYLGDKTIKKLVRLM
jgi:hypothetical protein